MSQDLDQIALDTATDIMAMYFEPIPGVHLKAKIQCAVREAIDAARPAAPVEAPLTDVKPLAKGHREDYYLMANARRVAGRTVAEISRMPNWVLAMELFATGSTSACQICRDAGIDPEALKVERIQSQRESAS